jgi:molybdenum cofactor guanylyltransferase
MDSKNITAVILAGGQSSRMGQDKALLTVNGLPLIHQIYSAARQCTDAVYVVSPWIASYRSRLPTDAILRSELAPQGPLVAFAQVLPELATPWILLLACDLPYVSSAVLQDWISQRDRVEADRIALLPRSPKGWEPLCGLYRQSCRESLQTFLTQGGRSFQTWLQTQPVAELWVSDQRVLFNCNTPQDFAIVQAEEA